MRLAGHVELAEARQEAGVVRQLRGDAVVRVAARHVRQDDDARPERADERRHDAPRLGRVLQPRVRQPRVAARGDAQDLRGGVGLLAAQAGAAVGAALAGGQVQDARCGTPAPPSWPSSRRRAAPRRRGAPRWPAGPRAGRGRSRTVRGWCWRCRSRLDAGGSGFRDRESPASASRTWRLRPRGAPTRSIPRDLPPRNPGEVNCEIVPVEPAARTGGAPSPRPPPPLAGGGGRTASREPPRPVARSPQNAEPPASRANAREAGGSIQQGPLQAVPCTLSPVTRSCRLFPIPCSLFPAVHSYRSASTGSSRAALNAGYSPKPDPRDRGRQQRRADGPQRDRRRDGRERGRAAARRRPGDRQPDQCRR